MTSLSRFLCELTGMPEAGDGDVGLFQALPGPHSPKPVRYSPTGDSHLAPRASNRTKEAQRKREEPAGQRWACPTQAIRRTHKSDNARSFSIKTQYDTRQ